jgi:hypothetical protein
MAIRDAQRFRKVYSYYRPTPRIEGVGGGGGGGLIGYWESLINGYLHTTGSAAFNGGDATYVDTFDVGTDVFFYVSGSSTRDQTADAKAVFGGDTVFSGSMFVDNDVYVSANFFELTGTLRVSGSAHIESGSLVATRGISGSLTNLSDGTSYLVAGTGISIISQSNGPVTISSTLNVVSGTASSYSVGLSDQMVVFTLNNVTASLPGMATVGTRIIFKDGTGKAGSVGPQLLSVTSPTGLIDSSPTYSLPAVNYSSITVVRIEYNPERWVVV